MQFTTPVTIHEADNKITYKSNLISIGSCFAQNMADKLGYFKFSCMANPFGILFHPVAVADMLTRAANNDYFTDNDITFHNGRFHCFGAHSDLSCDTKEQLLHNLKDILIAMRSQIQASSHIIITYGTAWAYRHIESDKLVANCHKIPQSQFTKELLSIGQIENAVQETITTIHKLNPEAQIIFTISPVRHIKDGIVENQRSKAHLIAALHETLERKSGILNDESQVLNYFPSYEIMMDELRDYRFYGQDMLHPSQVAIDYIWERFVQAWISEEAFGVMEEVSGIQKGLQHRAFNEESEGHRQFLLKLQEKIAGVEREFPGIRF